MRVDFPAPFSPTSACTSPARAENETRSFARTRGKRLVIARSSTASVKGLLLELEGDLDLPLDDVLLEGLDLGVHVVGDELLVVLVVDVADAVVGEAELADAAQELALGLRLDRVEDGD